jgi:hypothetical protein
MKYSIKEFANQIRNLYPNDYNDLTDEKLVELWLKKYPNDISKINLIQTETVRYISKEEPIYSSSSNNSYIKYIIIAIICFIAFKTNPTSQDFIDAGVEQYSKKSGNTGNDTLISGLAGAFLENNINRTDFYVCSYFDFKLDDSFITNTHVKVKAFGIFGHVFFLSYSN